MKYTEKENDVERRIYRIYISVAIIFHTHFWKKNITFLLHPVKIENELFIKNSENYDNVKEPTYNAKRIIHHQSDNKIGKK